MYGSIFPAEKQIVGELFVQTFIQYYKHVYIKKIFKAVEHIDRPTAGHALVN